MSAAFALALHRRLRQQRQNLVFSPWSIGTVIQMAALGARGQTLAEMRQVTQAASLEASDAVAVANGLWISNVTPLLPAFMEAVRREFDADAHGFDSARPAEACEAINLWVAAHTRGRITRLLDDIGNDAALVLLNAVAFHARWHKPFDKQMTHDEPFFCEDGSQASVPFMVQRGLYPYVEAATFRAVKLPYADSPLSMVVFLPTEQGRLDSLEATLSDDLFASTLSRLRTTTIDLLLPRFSVESRASALEGHLAALGMPTAFQPAVADFSGINGFAPPHERSLYISNVEHRATIDVDEAGTEATAATAFRAVLVGVMPRLPPPVPEFRADHPFLFAIRHRPTGEIVFLGRVADPRT